MGSLASVGPCRAYGGPDRSVAERVVSHILKRDVTMPPHADASPPAPPEQVTNASDALRELADQLTSLPEVRLSHFNAQKNGTLGVYVAHDVVTGLTLNGCDRRELPSSVAGFPSLEQLSVAKNELAELPGWIAALRGLTELYIYGNKLTRLPREVGALTHLLVLDLSHQPLQSLPESIGDLQRLVTLYCSETQIQTVPDGLWRCPALAYAGLTDNQLTELSAEVGNASQL